MAARISKADFDEKVLKSKLPVIVDFYSDSCVACKKLAPVLGDIEDDYEDKLHVYKVNTNFDGELADEYEVTANPTLLFVKDAEVLDRKIGVQKPADLKAWVEALLEALSAVSASFNFRLPHTFFISSYSFFASSSLINEN